MARYVFITGGVVSSLGKGLASAALGALLQARGFSVRLRKLDPYLNVDPGTMSPFEHGEVFVLDDGAELVGRLIESHPDLLDKVEGATETTTTGILKVRAMTGEGVLPLPEYVRALPPDMPVALEIPMMRMQETVPPAQRARMAIAATLALLEKEGSR